MNGLGKTVLLWLIIGFLLLALFNLFQGSARHSPPNRTPYSDFIGQVNRGEVTDVTVQGKTIVYTLIDKRILSTQAMDDPGLVDRLTAKNVKFKSVPLDDDMPTMLGILISWFPMLLLIAVLIFFLRKIQAAVSQKTPEAKG